MFIYPLPITARAHGSELNVFIIIIIISDYSVCVYYYYYFIVVCVRTRVSSSLFFVVRAKTLPSHYFIGSGRDDKDDALWCI